MEIWKPIPSYEGFYEASNMGRIRSVPHITSHPRNNDMPFARSGKIRKPRYDKNGYAILNLSKNGVFKTCKVHRLVAEAFIPNPDNLQQIDHINGKVYDNRVENLRWCTTQQNTKYRDEHHEIGDRARYRIRCKETGMEFRSSYDASFWVMQNGYSKNSTNYKTIAKSIRSCCLGDYKSSYGFHWAFAEGSTTSSENVGDVHPERVSSTIGG